VRILFVADGRSPTALNWIGYFAGRDCEVHLISTYPAEPELKLASLHILSVAFSQAAGRAPQNLVAKPSLIKRVTTAGMRTRFRQWLGPLTLPKAAHTLQTILTDVQPDLVHALRIPYEGMLAAESDPRMPLLISVWGNDFTLHGVTTPIMRGYTRKAVRRADAVMADCQRDIRLAREWGLPADRPTMVLPGGGGLQPELFYPPQMPNPVLAVINPRGIRAYVRNDTFFHAIPLVLAERPEVRFVCPSMAGEPQAEKWVSEMGIAANVDLLPKQTRPQMADLFRSAQVAVSPSEHDGTPNTLLEAMACGCFPVAGDIESVREWIEDGENGLLVDPADPRTLAAGILRGLEDSELREKAHEKNTRLIAEKAAYGGVMARAKAFYEEILE
jgi:glycosyltransferase involved in cell wall biosynthesis